MDVGTAQQLFSSYRLGLLKPKGAPPPTTPTFAYLTNNALLNVAPLRDRQLFHRSHAAATRGLGKARTGDLEAAGESFDQSRAVLAESGGESAAILIALSFLEAAEAYLDARRGDFESSRQRLEMSLDLDLRLEIDFDLGFLQLHRVQNVHNIARLFWKSARLADGNALIGAVIAFLEGRSSSLPIHWHWSPRRHFHSPPALRRAMLTQVLEEATFQLALHGSEDGWHALIGNAGPVAITQSSEASLHPQANLWLRAEAARLWGDDEAYLDQLPAFLASGRHEIGNTWYLAVATFAEFCRQHCSKESLYVRSAILRDSVKWPQVPPPITAWLAQAAPGA